MAATACMGYGEKQIISVLPAKIAPSKVLLVGIRNWERDEIKVRQQQYGTRNITGEEVAEKQWCNPWMAEILRSIEGG